MIRLTAFLFAVVIVVCASVAFRGRLSTPSRPVRIGTSVGDVAPDFALRSLTDRSYRLSSRHEPSRLVFFCGCDRCHRAAVRIGQLQERGELTDLTFVIALPADDASIFARQAHLAGDILPDPSDATAESYQSTDCPRMWVVGADRRIVYRSPPELSGRGLGEALRALQRTSAGA